MKALFSLDQNYYLAVFSNEDQQNLLGSAYLIHLYDNLTMLIDVIDLSILEMIFYPIWNEGNLISLNMI
jgi:hypothetical protein